MTTWLVAITALVGALFCLVAFDAIRRMRASTRNTLDVFLALTAVVVALASLGVSGVALQQQRAEAEEGGANPDVSGISDTGSVTINGNAGTGFCVQVQGDCPSGVLDPKELSLMPVDKAQSVLRQVAGSELPPQDASGPHIYIVLGTNDQGLFIRDGITANDRRLPGEPVIMDARPVYVDCKHDDGWLADPAAPNKAELKTWLRVRFPEPADRGSFYVYGGYTFPVGHNGDIPVCEGE